MGKPAVYVFKVNIYDNTKAPRLQVKRGAFVLSVILPAFLRHVAEALISPSRLRVCPASCLS